MVVVPYAVARQLNLLSADDDVSLLYAIHAQMSTFSTYLKWKADVNCTHARKATAERLSPLVNCGQPAGAQGRRPSSSRFSGIVSLRCKFPRDYLGGNTFLFSFRRRRELTDWFIFHQSICYLAMLLLWGRRFDGSTILFYLFFLYLLLGRWKYIRNDFSFSVILYCACAYHR